MGYAKPYTYKMEDITRMIRTGPGIMFHIGDSLRDQQYDGQSSVRAGCMFRAALTGLQVYNGVTGVVINGSQASTSSTVDVATGQWRWNYLSAIAGVSANNATTSTKAAAAGGFATLAGTAAGDFVMRYWLTAAGRAAHYGGDKFSSSAGCTAWKMGIVGIPGLASEWNGNGTLYNCDANDSGANQNTGSGNTTKTWNNANIGSGYQTLAAYFPANRPVTANNPMIGLAYGSVGGTSKINIIGTRIEAIGVRGWRHVAQASSGLCWFHYDTTPYITDAAIEDWFKFSGIADYADDTVVLWFNLGTNVSSGEYTKTQAQWVSYLTTLVTRVRTRATTAGVNAGRLAIVLSVPHNTVDWTANPSTAASGYQNTQQGRSSTFYETLEGAVYDFVTQQRAAGWIIGMVNEYRLSTPDSANSSTAARPSTRDGTHWTLTGASEQMSRINQALSDCLAPTVSTYVRRYITQSNRAFIAPR